MTLYEDTDNFKKEYNFKENQLLKCCYTCRHCWFDSIFDFDYNCNKDLGLTTAPMNICDLYEPSIDN